jgi:hypothetical protein
MVLLIPLHYPIHLVIFSPELKIPHVSYKEARSGVDQANPVLVGSWPEHVGQPRVKKHRAMVPDVEQGQQKTGSSIPKLSVVASRNKRWQ